MSAPSNADATACTNDGGHSWRRGGLVYEHDDTPIAGTGARRRVYSDRFYCAHCLASRYTNARPLGTSYDAPIAGSTPKRSERE